MGRVKKVTLAIEARELADTVLAYLKKGKLGDSVLLRWDEVTHLDSLCRNVKGTILGEKDYE